MKILVLVKVIKGEINPFDQCAIEAALTLSGDVTVLSMAPPSAKDALLPLTRLGAKVKMLCDSAFAGSDTLATAYILSCAIKKMEYDLIICGRQSIDGDTAQTGPLLSEMLSVPVITNVLELNCSENEISCRTRLSECEKAPLPALITVERINKLRFPSLRSKVGEVEVLSNDFVGADTEKCGLSGSPTRVLKTFESSMGQRKCKFISKGELMEVIEKSLSEKEEAIFEKKSGEKVSFAFAIGEEVFEKTKEIAEKVELILEKDPQKIADMILLKKPVAVLWNADIWGRRTAPIVAAKLSLGLCADCTHFECSGETLYMYRPAGSGSIIAKIKSLTLPQMATARVVSESSNILVSTGAGAVDALDRIKAFAKEIGGTVAASRSAVDKGVLPYECQVGLTGKNVSPAIYIAIGISGAVQHTCAIESAKTVIAINPDKDARIFEYADYGIVSKIEDVIK